MDGGKFNDREPALMEVSLLGEATYKAEVSRSSPFVLQL